MPETSSPSISSSCRPSTFRLLFVFVVLRHDRRELLHLNVTDHPTAVWTARQIIEAFPDETAPRYLLRDRDAIYGEEFVRRVARMGIREVRIAPRAPWQNPFVERVIGSIRRECLDHVLILSEAHLRRLLRATAPTTTPRGHTNRLTTTVPSHGPSNPHHVAGSSSFLRSAGSITATSAPPDPRDRDPPSLAPSTMASAPAPLTALHIFARRCGRRPWTIKPSVKHRDTGADEVSNRDTVHTSGSEDSGSDPKRLNQPWSHRDTGR